MAHCHARRPAISTARAMNEKGLVTEEEKFSENVIEMCV